MQTERRRALRHFLGGAVEVTELESEKELVTVTRNLSLFGCFVATATPFVTGAKVRLRITHRGATFAALGWVAYASASEGMGMMVWNCVNQFTAWCCAIASRALPLEPQTDLEE